MTHVKYNGPHDSVDLPNGQVVRRGEVVGVPDDLAGRVPDPEVEGDKGEGLLAQTDVWEPADPQTPHLPFSDSREDNGEASDDTPEDTPGDEEDPDGGDDL